MQALSSMSKNEIEKLYNQEKIMHEKLKNCNLNINIARGKPNSAQLDLSNELLTCLKAEDIKKFSNDYRNYGILGGIPEAKKLFAPILGISEDEITVCGNSSLSIMYECISWAMDFGVPGGKKTWREQGKIKFLCPVPGYDRHFAITEQFGIEMITVPMTEDGPDMDEVERLVNNDASIKGIWCVPKYSNPDGIVYSDETVRRFANLKPAADDFRIFWDNAYGIHDLYEPIKLLNILDECKKAGNENLPFIFFSTSKISFAGAGVAVIGCSKENTEWYQNQLSIKSISNDKINQLRHVKFFKDADGLLSQMKKHAEILRPKFEAVINKFDKELKELDCVSFHRPKGGYFISLNVEDGCAKRTIELCKDAGVSLTPAGSTFPYKNDPCDKNIRIAPSFIEVSNLETACEVLCNSVKLATLEKHLEK